MPESTNPPFDRRAEAALLGAVLLDNSAIDNWGDLQVEHFYREAHRHICQAILELVERGRPIDTVTLSEQLRTSGNLQAAGGGAYLVQLSNETPAAVNAAHYARIVRDKFRLRQASLGA